MRIWVLLAVAAGTIPLAGQNYVPATAVERGKWFADTSYGARSLLVAGPLVSAMRTARNTPREWGPGWEGFGKRYGARLVTTTVNYGVETSFGALWDEDPRYYRVGQGSLKERAGAAVKQTFLARYRSGEYHFAAARAMGVFGSSFGQKIWMPDSVTSNRDCSVQVSLAYAERLAINTIKEFGPDIRKILKKKKR